MSSLGEFLPKNLRDELAQRNLVAGAVIKTFVKDTIPPKEKYFIVVAFSPDRIAVATVYINSEINPNKFATEELKKFHLELKVDENPFLTYNSYADCTQLHEKDYEVLLKLLQEHPTTHIAILQEDLLKKVKDNIKATRLISIALKKKYGLFF